MKLALCQVSMSPDPQENLQKSLDANAVLPDQILSGVEICLSIVGMINGQTKVPCIGCGYCEVHCVKKLPIADRMKAVSRCFDGQK